MTDINWLITNKDLRMDANLGLFAESRRRLHLERYQFASKLSVGKRVLDGACGTGYGSAILGGVAKEVVGIDCDADSIQYATSTYGNPNVRFERAYVELTDFAADAFEVVVSFETVEHTLCPVAHITEITRLLTADGKAVLSVPNRWGLTDHHYWDFNFDMLRKLVEPRFGEVEYYYNNSNDAGGRRQGIGRLDPSNLESAECILAVCSGVVRTGLESQSYIQAMKEIYEGVFERHIEFLRLKKNWESVERAASEKPESLQARIVRRFAQWLSRIPGR